ncbi:DUF2441 domain-containing protein [Bdellovibrio bacteriovorus]|uniref:DUF2441 domain-containing protein n=1 Tax=Bdellovibrio bacteriovorus TaxID=959 RepID=UPI0035A622AC
MHLAHYTDCLTLKIGEVLDTSSLIPTRYWLSKFKQDAVPMHEVLLGKDPPPTIENQIATKVLELVGTAFSKAKLELLKEYIFEDVRQSEFPHLPSRKKAVFFLDESDDTDEKISRFSSMLARREKMVFRGIEEKHLIFRADANFLNCNMKSTDEIFEFARRYWKGEALTSEPFLKFLVLDSFQELSSINSAVGCS